MVSAAQVVAEVLRLGIYSTSDLRSKKLQVVQGADKNTFDLTLRGVVHTGLTGAEVVRACAEARGVSVRFGRGGYKASQQLVDALMHELALGAAYPGTDAALEEMLSPAPGRSAGRPTKADALAAGGPGPRKKAAAARATEAWQQGAEGKRGAALLKVYEVELRRWQAAHAALVKAELEQENDLALLKQQESKMRSLMLRAERAPQLRQSMHQLLDHLQQKLPQDLQLLESKEEEARTRCRTVLDCIERDPTAQLLLLRKSRRGGGFGTALVIAVVLLGAIAAACWAVRCHGVEGLQAFIAKMREALPNTL